MEEQTEGTLIKFSDDTELGGAKGLPFKGLCCSWRRGRQKARKIQQGQMLSPAPGKKVCLAVIQARDRLPAEKLCRDGLEVLVDNELSISQQCALAATRSPSILGYMSGSTGRRRVVFPLCSALHPVLPPAPNINKLE